MASPAAHSHSSTGLSDVKTSIYFMQRDKLFAEEKPYEFCYTADASIPQSNIAREKQDDVTIHDIRGQEQTFKLEPNGFTVLKLDECSPYDDHSDPIKVTRYLRSLETLLKKHLGASHVEVFRHGLRKRHTKFPIATGTGYEFDQPTSVAHVDTTVLESLEEVKRQHGEKADRFLGKRVQWINVWKPLRGPLYDWPLAFCDATTVNPATDLEHADLLYPEFVTENCQVYFNPDTQWCYLSGQEIDELIVFKQSDTLAGSSPGWYNHPQYATKMTNRDTGVPHCSFFNPHAPAHEPPRESIEARALVYYD